MVRVLVKTKTKQCNIYTARRGIDYFVVKKWIGLVCIMYVFMPWVFFFIHNSEIIHQPRIRRSHWIGVRLLFIHLWKRDIILGGRINEAGGAKGECHDILPTTDCFGDFVRPFSNFSNVWILWIWLFEFSLYVLEYIIMLESLKRDQFYTV